MKKFLTLVLIIFMLILSSCQITDLKLTYNNNKPTEPIKGVSNNLESTNNDESSNKPVEDQKLIALTFDDGPSRNTKKILKTLNKYNAHATFFVLGERIEYNEDTLKSMVDNGHDIGIHTWNHKQLTKLNREDIEKQIFKTQKAIYKATNYTSKLLRPPFGAYNQKVVKIAKKNNMSIINWNIDTLDWESKNKKKISKIIMKSARNGCIILSHDLYDATVEAYDIVIPELIKQGYKFVTVTELLNSYNGSITPGAVYYNRWEVE